MHSLLRLVGVDQVPGGLVQPGIARDSTLDTREVDDPGFTLTEEQEAACAKVSALPGCRFA